MQVVIQSEGDVREFSLIELQGDLETKSEDALGGKLIGDLHFNLDANPILIIGHHILHGKVQELDKPLVVFLFKAESLSQVDKTWGGLVVQLIIHGIV